MASAVLDAARRLSRRVALTWGRRLRRWARYDLPLIFTMIAPSTIRSRNAIASGGSPRYSPHASKSMFVTSAVERCGLRASITL